MKTYKTLVAIADKPNRNEDIYSLKALKEIADKEPERFILEGNDLFMIYHEKEKK
jgi:hypothetical protein